VRIERRGGFVSDVVFEQQEVGIALFCPLFDRFHQRPPNTLTAPPLRHPDIGDETIRRRPVHRIERIVRINDSRVEEPKYSAIVFGN
jgi:hypothetical protein